MTDPYIELDIPLFREQIPQYADATTYPDAQITMYWGQATCYVSDYNNGSLTSDCRQLAINLMTAHLLWILGKAQNGNTPGLKASATIDRVSVSLTPPPLKSQWQWWLSLSPYGQQLFALLQARSVGGFYIGGLPERYAIRKVFGIFGT